MEVIMSDTENTEREYSEQAFEDFQNISLQLVECWNNVVLPAMQAAYIPILEVINALYDTLVELGYIHNNQSVGMKPRRYLYGENNRKEIGRGISRRL
jgi:hypothetical protein